MTFDIDVQLACDEKDLPLPGVQMVEHIDAWVRAALQAPTAVWQRAQEWLAPVSFRQSAQLTVRLVDVAEGATLNQDYRQGQGPTNVLSFPFDEPFKLQPPLLGDVVICAPRVVVEAGEQGKPLLAHWAHLVVHGVLHLLGYDHLDVDQARIMEGLEVLVLAQLGYSDPYNEQGHQDEI
jgi:probable rRNA maturation factor